MRGEEEPQEATVIENGKEVKAILVERPLYSHDSFPRRDRFVGVIIITVIVILALSALKTSIWYMVVSIISLLVVSYVIAVHKKKPAFEGMVYVLVIIGILAAAVGSTTSSGLEIYAAGMTVLLLLLFGYMTRNPLCI